MIPYNISIELVCGDRCQKNTHPYNDENGSFNWFVTDVFFCRDLHGGLRKFYANINLMDINNKQNQYKQVFFQ